jgi:hypothetical protein
MMQERERIVAKPGEQFYTDAVDQRAHSSRIKPGRTRPAHVRSRGSETLLRIRSLAGYTIDIMHESRFRKRHLPRDELRRVAGFSVAHEIEKLDRLKNSGSITEVEFARLRARLVHA